MSLAKAGREGKAKSWIFAHMNFSAGSCCPWGNSQILTPEQNSYWSFFGDGICLGDIFWFKFSIPGISRIRVQSQMRAILNLKIQRPNLKWERFWTSQKTPGRVFRRRLWTPLQLNPISLFPPSKASISLSPALLGRHEKRTVQLLCTRPAPVTPSNPASTYCRTRKLLTFQSEEVSPSWRRLRHSRGVHKATSISNDFSTTRD